MKQGKRVENEVDTPVGECKVEGRTNKEFPRELFPFTLETSGESRRPCWFNQGRGAFIGGRWMAKHDETRDRCKSCNSPNLVERLRPDTQHHAELVCADCGTYQCWLPKPDSKKAKRPAAHRELVKKFSRGFCVLCLTKEGDLPKGRALEGHHIEEYQHDGSDDRENVQIVCTGCHKLIHWRRTYLEAVGQ